MARLSEAERERIKLHRKVGPGLPKIRTVKPLVGQREFNFEASTAMAGNEAGGSSEQSDETGPSAQAFNYEVEQEKQDAAQIEATQSIARSVLWGIVLEGAGDE